MLGLAVRVDEVSRLKTSSREGVECHVGEDKERYRAVLAELRSLGRSQLKSVPVFYVNTNNQNVVIPTHGYVVVGHPGKGRKSGAVLYSVGGDPYRGPVSVSKQLIRRLNRKKGVLGSGGHVYSSVMRETVALLAGQFFDSREAFYLAYQQARVGEKGVEIDAEIKKIYRLLSPRTMELWPRLSNGYLSSKPNAAERDLRIFERSSLDVLQPRFTKQFERVRAIDLLDVHRAFLLHRLFADEKLGRWGTGIPSVCYQPRLELAHSKVLLNQIGRYQRLPTFGRKLSLPAFQSPLVGNCNTGAASLLQKAMEGGPQGSGRSEVCAASSMGIGVRHRMRLWDPLVHSDVQNNKPVENQFSFDTLQAQMRGRWSPLYVHRDTEARLLNTVPSSEFYQKQLVQMAVRTAQHFAIITSYQISPSQDRNPDHISASMFAVLEALACRQGDKNFSLAFMYNSNDLEYYTFVSSLAGRTPITKVVFEESAQERTVTWQAVVEKYNKQQVNPELRITKLQCAVFFVEAVAVGLAGSQHNKFVINDQGVAATLGASLGNRTKDHWLDGGCVAISGGLVRQQLNYFFKQIQMHQANCVKFEVNKDAFSATPIDMPSFKHHFRSEVIQERRDVDFCAALKEFGFEFAADSHDVLWVQNPPSGYANMLMARKGMRSKPIGFAFSEIALSAKAGDELSMTAKKVGCEAFSLISNVLKKGCDVKVLVDRGFRPMLERRAKWFYSGIGGKLIGRLFIKHYQPNADLLERYHLNGSEPGVLHAKNYILTRRNQKSHVIMTGSYNLDGQSHYRSGENMMLFNTEDKSLRQALFDDFYEHSDSVEQVFHGPDPNPLT